MQEIVLAAGCFWCYEPLFSSLKGVDKVVVGYAGGLIKPTYELVASGSTNFAECFKVTYNPKEISLETLLDVFFSVHDPTSLNKQGNDYGTQYRSAVFVKNDFERNVVAAKIDELETSNLFDKPIVTKVEELGEFYEAEDYHKKYYENNKNAPYCDIIIAPKIIKFKENFKALLKA